MSSVRKLTLCKMCARLATWESPSYSIALCKECLDYVTVMGREDPEQTVKDAVRGVSRPMPPWEKVALRRAQEHIESDLAESMLF